MRKGLIEMLMDVLNLYRYVCDEIILNWGENLELLLYEEKSKHPKTYFTFTRKLCFWKFIRNK